MSSRGTSTEPESGILARGNCLKKTSLQPVVDAWMVELCNPGSGVAGADQVSCRPLDSLNYWLKARLLE